MVSPSAHADDAAGYGPIRLGMSIAQVRAALPSVTWNKPRDGEDPSDPVVLRAQSASIGGETFDINYVDESWGAFSLGLSGAVPDSSAGCRQRVLKVLTAVEDSNGALLPPPMKSEFTGRIETIRFGKSSEGSMLALTLPNGAETYVISAERKAGSLQINAGGRYAPGASQGACSYAVSISIDPPRPPPGDLPFASLSVVRDVSIGVKHHSLDLIETPRDTTITLECTFGKYGELNCPDRSTRGLKAAARWRIQDMRIARRTKDGGWTPYQRTTIPVRIGTTDRIAITRPVDTSKQSLLVQTLNLQYRPRFPEGAPERNASAVVDVGCTVQADGSLVCSEFKVTPSGRYDAEFSAEAARAIVGLRFAPTLKDGTPSLGVGYRSTVEFKVH